MYRGLVPDKIPFRLIHEPIIANDVAKFMNAVGGAIQLSILHYVLMPRNQIY